uniref:Uncharacterized protein n=1 Tax=Plectus sambesii TaxID=2011161 RepID=A0A914USB9_9BILA
MKASDRTACVAPTPLAASPRLAPEPRPRAHVHKAVALTNRPPATRRVCGDGTKSDKSREFTQRKEKQNRTEKNQFTNKKNERSDTEDSECDRAGTAPEALMISTRRRTRARTVLNERRWKKTRNGSSTTTRRHHR